jgi:hypothetical protein
MCYYFKLKYTVYILVISRFNNYYYSNIGFSCISISSKEVTLVIMLLLDFNEESNYFIAELL